MIFAQGTELAVSATLALSTRTQYVDPPFQPMSVGYEGVHATAEFLLSTTSPDGDVLAEASNMVCPTP